MFEKTHTELESPQNQSTGMVGKQTSPVTELHR